MITKLIKSFLFTYCKQAEDDEPLDYVELMMDNHYCINYEGQDWYVPTDDSGLSNDESLLKEMIVNTFEI
jgi:hypothetical protein